jgi:hypothetical protein
MPNGLDTRAFAAVTCRTQQLQVPRPTAAAFADRHDMVDIVSPCDGVPTSNAEAALPQVYSAYVLFREMAGRAATPGFRTSGGMGILFPPLPTLLSQFCRVFHTPFSIIRKPRAAIDRKPFGLKRITTLHRQSRLFAAFVRDNSLASVFTIVTAYMRAIFRAPSSLRFTMPLSRFFQVRVVLEDRPQPPVSRLIQFAAFFPYLFDMARPVSPRGGVRSFPFFFYIQFDFPCGRI